METMERKRPRARRSFTPKFKAEIVALCQHGDCSVGQVARDFDLTETAVREWVRLRHAMPMPVVLVMPSGSQPAWTRQPGRRHR